jgi:YidC/Oxa1 family membrane protein insertase
MTATTSSSGADPWTVRIVTVILIIAMSVTVFTTQKQLTMKNMPQSAMENPMFRAQKMMLYMMPVIFAFSGINFPIGVLVYWLATNLWSMGQQFIVIRNMPVAGSEADKRRQERLAAKRARKGLDLESGPGGGEAGGPGGAKDGESAAKPVGGQRQQPKRNVSRAKRKGAPGAAGGAGEPTPDQGSGDADEDVTSSDAKDAADGSNSGGKGESGGKGGSGAQSGRGGKPGQGGKPGSGRGSGGGGRKGRGR